MTNLRGSYGEINILDGDILHRGAGGTDKEKIYTIIERLYPTDQTHDGLKKCCTISSF